MQINVNVTDLDVIDLNTVIGEDVAYYNPETEETEYRPRTLGDVLLTRLIEHATKSGEYRDVLREKVTKIRDEVIREQIEPLITEALTGSILATNAYGEPTGGATTLRELIANRVNAYVTASGQGYHREPSPFQKLLAQEVSRQFTKELTDVISVEKEKARQMIRAHAAKVVADTVISLGK